MSSNTQIVISQFGGTDCLELIHSEIPEPKEGEVLVKVAYASVNPIDVKTRAGMGWAAEHNKHSLPWVPGYDISGYVVKHGVGANKFNLNEAVAGFVGFPLRGGAYSQYICVPESELALIPDDIDIKFGAAIPLVGQTAAQALEKVKIQPKERVLILAGAGGVGHIAVQIAVAAKCEVYATSSADNLEFVRSLGATALDYNDPQACSSVSDIDVLVDLVGGDVALKALESLRPGSRVVTVPTITSSAVCSKASELGLISMGILVDSNTIQLEELLKLISSGMIKVEIEKEYPLEQAALAHQKIEAGHARGKILLAMNAE